MSLIGAINKLAKKRSFKLFVVSVILISIVLLNGFLYLVLSNNDEVLSSSKFLNAKDNHFLSKNDQNTEPLGKNGSEEVYIGRYSHMGHYHAAQKTKIEPYSIWNNSIDESVDPCDDFYAFTCGNYMPNRRNYSNEDTEDLSETLIGLFKDFGTPNARSQALPEVEKCLKEAVFGNKPSNSTAVAKMRRFRDIMISGLEARTGKQMVSQMKMIGGCPAVLGQEHFDENFDFVEALSNMVKFTGKRPLFNAYNLELSNGSFVFVIEPDNFTMTKPVKYLDSTGVVLDKFVVDNQKYFHNLFELAVKQVDGIASDLDESARELALLEQKVFQFIVEDNFERQQKNQSFGFRNSQVDPVNFDELDYYLPVINGTNYYMKIFDFMPEMVNYFKDNPTIYLNTKNVLMLLNDLYGSMEKKTMANYLCVFYLIEHQTILRIESAIKGNPEFKKWWKSEALIDKLQRLFGLVTDNLYVNECIDAEDLKSVSKMADEIQQTSLKMIEKQDWLDSLTKFRALQKLKSMKKIIGSLDVALDVKQLDNHYELLNFNSQDTLHDISAKLDLFIESTIFRVIVTQEKSIDVFHATEINAIRLLKENTIVIYAGNFYPPNFDSNRPDSLNYGSIGWAIGHEIWHMFKENSTFNENGLTKNLWTPKSYEKFKERARCFVSQYDELEVIYSYGTKTLNENIADISGLKAAYYTYKEQSKCGKKISSFTGSSCWAVDGKPTKVLGYEKYSDDQSFFISYGTSQCINRSELAQLLLAIKATHPIDYHRVNEVLKNMPEFAKAFNCPLGSEMNPKHKCEMF